MYFKKIWSFKPSFHNSRKLKTIRDLMFSVVWNGSFVNRYQCFKPLWGQLFWRWRQKVTPKQWYISTIPYRHGAQLDELQQLHFRMQMRQNKLKLYVHLLVDKLKWFYENARCYNKIYKNKCINKIKYFCLWCTFLFLPSLMASYFYSS